MKTVFILADSISILYGPQLRMMLSGQFSVTRKGGIDEALIHISDDADYNGADSESCLNYFNKEFKDGFCHDILLLNCGLHDIRRIGEGSKCQVSIERYCENIRAIVRKVKQDGKKVYFVNTTHVVEEIHNARPLPCSRRYNVDVVRYNAAAQNIMKQEEVPLIDLYAFTKNLGDDLLYDHVHFKTEYSRLQAAFIAGALQSEK